MGERCQVSGVPDKSGFPPHCTGGQVRFAPTGVGGQGSGKKGDGETGERRLGDWGTGGKDRRGERADEGTWGLGEQGEQRH